MNTLTVELSEETFSLIPKEIREESTVIKREPKNYDYKQDRDWRQLNIESIKAFLKLSVFEDDMINNGGEFIEEYSDLKSKSYKAFKKKKEREYQIRKLNGDLN